MLEISSEGTRKGKDRDIPNRGDWPAGAQRWEKPGHAGSGCYLDRMR